ncbi:hypothetical protein [Ruminobacter sp.]|uniref:hypothetical protein n=1 Tax=Ruminobacter sp. TaxID=2774296 RepID=UPI00386B5B00
MDNIDNKKTIFQPLTAEEWKIRRLSDLLIKAEISLSRVERYYRRLLIKVMMMLGALILMGLLMLFM